MMLFILLPCVLTLLGKTSFKPHTAASNLQRRVMVMCVCVCVLQVHAAKNVYTAKCTYM